MSYSSLNTARSAISNLGLTPEASQSYVPIGRHLLVLKFVRSRQPGIISLMSYSLLWFVKINTELLRGVFTTQRFDTPV